MVDDFPQIQAMHITNSLYGALIAVIRYRGRRIEFSFVRNFLCLFDSSFAKLPKRGPGMVPLKEVATICGTTLEGFVIPQDRQSQTMAVFR